MDYKLVPKEDELYHWKYIRREKMANGKYRYYYEEDNNKIKSDRLRKHDFVDENGKSKYMIKPPGEDWRTVPKDVYDSFGEGEPELYVGTQRLDRLAKEQIEIGMNYIKDLLSGNLYR